MKTREEQILLAGAVDVLEALLINKFIKEDDIQSVLQIKQNYELQITEIDLKKALEKSRL